MEKLVYIYALEYPKGNIRYIGKTVNLQQRYARHLRDAKKLTTSHKLAWLNSLLKKGERPIMTIIDEVPIDDWVFWEQHYISLYLSWGFELTNSTFGGEGLLATEEVKKKISNSCKRHWANHKNWIYGKAGTVEASRVGRKKGAIIPDDLKKVYCENLNRYYQTHDVWNKGKTFRKPDAQHKEKSMKDPKNRVIQLTLNGEFVKEWGSASAAAHILGFNPTRIRDCCKGKIENIYGFIWMKKNVYEEWKANN